MSQLPIVLAGGTSSARASVIAAMERRNCRTTVVADDLRAGLVSALSEPVEAVVALLPAEAATGFEILRWITENPSLPSIVVVGSDETVRDGSAALGLGANDFVEDHTDRNRLYEALGLMLGTSRRDSELRFFRDRAAQSTSWKAVIGRSSAMQMALTRVQQILRRRTAQAAPPMLITGETGTGKGLVARCIHFNSPRRHEPYVDVNCAAIPPSLIEAELLGYERGAFTDAKTARAGLFETADRGSLFLDEIAALPVELQAKLLTVTEDKRVRRIGGREAKTVDVQIIAATHRDLAAMVASGQFREDLYHRLNVIHVDLPALRDRGEDKLHLAERFVDMMCKKYGLPTRDLSDASRQLISDHDWPGNVRELKNQIEQIILVADDFEIRPEHFSIVKRKISRVEVRAGADGLEVAIPEDGVSLEAVERSLIKEAMRRCDGNVSEAARFLSVSRQTLIYRLKKHQIASA
jgi:two-component system, NtrC family, response regulator AtoC